VSVSASKNILNPQGALCIGVKEPTKMPRKVDFHTEWTIPDPAGNEDAGSAGRESGTPIAKTHDLQKPQAGHAAQTPDPQIKEKSFVARRVAY
jgi:hypothetical protein